MITTIKQFKESMKNTIIYVYPQGHSKHSIDEVLSNSNIIFEFDVRHDRFIIDRFNDLDDMIDELEEILEDIPHRIETSNNITENADNILINAVVVFNPDILTKEELSNKIRAKIGVLTVNNNNIDNILDNIIDNIIDINIKLSADYFNLMNFDKFKNHILKITGVQQITKFKIMENV